MGQGEGDPNEADLTNEVGEEIGGLEIYQVRLEPLTADELAALKPTAEKG